jgi:hypothetical protein
VKPSRLIFAFLLGGIAVSILVGAFSLAILLGVFLTFLIVVAVLASYFGRPWDKISN